MERLSRFHPHFDFFLFGGDKEWLTIESMQKLFHAIGRNRLLPWLVIAGVVVLWLAPITLLGKMPIGGDVTSFFLPLMAYYRQALVDGRVPLWNELWGFGFPMLAESQTGVFYPPHVVLFRLFETETAYCLNIVIHSVLAGWFTYVCAREFGLKPWGATLAALVFAGNGFFIIHFPHQWSYTSGAWMPLAVALAWRAVKESDGGGLRLLSPGAPGAECQTRGSKIEDRGSEIEDRGPTIEERTAGVTAFGWRHRARPSLGLTVVLAVQMLAGHFQIAFYTQIVVLLIGLLCTLQRVFRGLRARTVAHGLPTSTQYSVLSTQKESRPPSKAKSRRRQQRSIQPWGSPAALVWLGVPLAGAFVLTAIQLLPTQELIRIALPEGRNFEYLSGFANTPFHLVSYLLPTLFHVNPLWRPVAWDPFHTSPEECFSYIGLLPICLAAGAAWRWRREPRVRLWGLLVAITLFLSLGPYVPGFKWLILLPGFDGFRSASRWSLVTALFLALLAGRACDGIRAGERLQRWIRGLAVIFVIVTVTYGSFLIALLDTSRPSSTNWIRAAETIRQVVTPWPAEPGVGQIAKTAEQYSNDVSTYGKLAGLTRIRPDPDRGDAAVMLSLGAAYVSLRAMSLSDERWAVLLVEMLPPAVMLLVTWAITYRMRGRRRVQRVLIVGIVIVDLGAATWLRPTDFAPRGSLLDRSPVLSTLATGFSGERGMDPFQNLAMFAGAAPVQSYRTVDIPILGTVNGIIEDPRFVPVETKNRMLARCDVRWRVHSGSPEFRRFGVPIQAGDRDTLYTDRLLGRITFGSALAREFPDTTSRFFRRRSPDLVGGRAWFFPDAEANEAFTALTDRQLHSKRYRPAAEKLLFDLPAEPIQSIRADSESSEFEFHAAQPGFVVVTELAYPGWKAALTADGAEREVAVLGFAGCRAVQVPRAGDYRLQFHYRSEPFQLGLRISIATLAAWSALMLLTILVNRRTTI